MVRVRIHINNQKGAAMPIRQESIRQEYRYPSGTSSLNNRSNCDLGYSSPWFSISSPVRLSSELD